MLFFLCFPCVGVRLVFWSVRSTATFEICFHNWSLLLAFSLHVSSSSAFLRSLYTQSSHLSCGLPRFLQPSCFFVSALFGNLSSFILTMFPAHFIRRYTPITSYPTVPLYNIIIIFDTVLRQKRICKRIKIMNSTALPSRYFGTHRQCFAAASLTWPAYGDGRKRENCSVWKYRIINIASTCRRSVQFGCYITWLWMANCASVMTKMLPLYNFIIPCRSRRAWKTSNCACAFAGNRLWLVESTLFGDHVSLRLHWEFSLKFNINSQELTRSI